MYLDIEEKIKFHKEKIIQSFIDLGIYPGIETVNKILTSVNARYSYLVTYKVKQGDYFDTATYNAMIQAIYNDLMLLYQILYEVTEKDFIALQAFAETHLANLEQRAHFYKEKAIQETNNTNLGKTLLFKNSGFDLTLLDSVLYCDLGSLELKNGSKVSCVLKGNNISASNTLFLFHDGETEYHVCPNNFNGDVFNVPGEIKTNEYDFKIDKDQIVTGAIKIDSVKPKAENQYTILGGHDKVLVKQFGETIKTRVMNKPTNVNELRFDEKSYVDFYIKGCKSITFTFNKKPTHTNFNLDSYTISNLDPIHHFFIETPTDFSFSFTHDGGEVYAIETSGILSDNKLLYTNPVRVDDFKVIEYTTEATTSYKCTIRLKNEDKIDTDIESVLIKELLKGGQ